jgi:periplasmic divalent cation tolerance protein
MKKIPTAFAMPTEYCLVLCTCPAGERAGELASKLVESGLAACVNVLPGLTSIYSWQGAVESSQESLLLIKSENRLYGRLESQLRDWHPYELPEIISVPIERGLSEYLHWISQCLSAASSS